MREAATVRGSTGTAAHPAPDPRNFRTRHTCLFLDVDGTLADLAPTPDEVRIGSELIALLERIHGQLEGALALISGRPLAQLDRLFAPLRLPAAGIHGFERRGGTHVVFRPTLVAESLGAVRAQLADAASSRPGLLLEDKGVALALHYRAAPEAADTVAALITAAAQRLGPGFEALEGDMVYELKPATLNKATAIEAFMTEEPFEGRIPIYIGDDYTDFDGFGAVRRNGGVDIAVGERVPARWHLPDPAAVRDWLRRFASQGPNPAR